MRIRRTPIVIIACTGVAIVLPFAVARAMVDPISVAEAPVTAISPTAVSPTAVSPAAVSPTTARPKAVRPTTARPKAVRPTTARPKAVRPTTARPTNSSTFDHIVVVVAENQAFDSVIGAPDAPYITSLAEGGAKMTNSYGLTHPSQPNYLALFSGSTQGVGDNSCPHTFSAKNLGQQLIDAGKTFAGYSEGMPSVGYTGCDADRYARKHNPWVNFDNVPTSSNRTFADFPTDYTKLPTVSFIVPDLCHDMHDCNISDGDAWLKDNIGAYAKWAKTHNSLLLFTFDEDDKQHGNRIPTLFSGAHVKAGTYAENVSQYSVLRTLQSLNGLDCLENSCSTEPITDIWN
jgi:phosphatidylinositol-3-phosphatase